MIELKGRAEEIRDEKAQGANTAERVGGLLVDMCISLDQMLTYTYNGEPIVKYPTYVMKNGAWAADGSLGGGSHWDCAPDEFRIPEFAKITIYGPLMFSDYGAIVRMKDGTYKSYIPGNANLPSYPAPTQTNPIGKYSFIMPKDGVYVKFSWNSAAINLIPDNKQSVRLEYIEGVLGINAPTIEQFNALVARVTALETKV